MDINKVPEHLKGIVDEQSLIAVNHFSVQQKKLAHSVLKSPLINNNPFVTVALLFMMAESILETAIVIDRNVFKSASKPHLMKIIEEFYNGKGDLASKVPEMLKRKVEQEA